MRDEMSLTDPPQADATSSATPESRLERLLPWGIAALFLGSASMLWATNGASVFATALSGLWALCF